MIHFDTWQRLRTSRYWRRAMDSFLVTVGYILSPLSWWNDLFVNIPLAYLFAVPFDFVDRRLFMPMFILGYWLSNLLGLILMHQGVSGLVNKERKQFSMTHSLLVAIVYTVVIILLVWLKWIPVPDTVWHLHQ